MMDYYDVILGLIPLTVAGVTGALTIVGVSLSAAVAVGAVLTVPLLGHAMFVNAPISTRSAPDRDVQTQSQSRPRTNSAD